MLTSGRPLKMGKTEEGVHSLSKQSCVFTPGVGSDRCGCFYIAETLFSSGRVAEPQSFPTDSPSVRSTSFSKWREGTSVKSEQSDHLYPIVVLLKRPQMPVGQVYRPEGRMASQSEPRS